MAYGEGGGRFWQVDLSTRAGAISATKTGSTGAFMMCAMAVLGAVVFGWMAGFTTSEGIVASLGALVEAGIALVAGLRFRAGKGLVWGGIATALMTLEALAKLLAFSIGGLIISGVVLVALVTGLRGAMALRSDRGFRDDEVTVFE